MGNIDQVPTPEIIEDEAAGGDENLKPNTAPASEEGNQEVETQVIDSPLDPRLRRRNSWPS